MVPGLTTGLDHPLAGHAAHTQTRFTAQDGAYRRRGVAFALKVRSLEFAKAGGYARVITENESNNRGMLAINDELGFVKNPAWVHYARSFAG